MGANLYLAKEMEDSLYLYNFVRSRGSPRAIEIVGKAERSAELLLFYPAKQEVYHASPQLDPMTKAKEWIIRGPYAIDRSRYRAVAQLGPETVGAFEIFGRRELVGASGYAGQARVLEPAFVPTPPPTPTPRRRTIRKQPASSTGTGPAISIQGTPMNFDQQAIMDAQKAPVANPLKAVPAVPAVASPVTAPAGPTTEIKKGTLDEALKATVLKTPSAKKTTP